MPQLRKDPITERWVIIVPERGEFTYRPHKEEPQQELGFCPFCYGNEDKTPAEILAYRRQGCGPNQQGWRVRVVPNRFPALQIEGRLHKAGRGLYDWMNGVGVHEVVIEHPKHGAGFQNYSIEEVEMILWAYRDRYVDLLNDRRFKYLMIFKNQGRTAGASIDHPHSQLIATPVVPKRVIEEISGAQKYFHYKERCVYCDMVRQELKDGSRVIASNESFVALCPFASRFPFEMVVLPRFHSSDFGSMEGEEIRACATVLREAMKRLLGTLDNPPYNYMIHTAPADELHMEHYHWHIEVVPRLTKVAGFEFGSGFYANPTPPEEAAQQLQAWEEEGE